MPTFRAFLEYGVELNGVGALVDVRAKAVGDKPGAEYELVVPQRGIWGTASIDGRNIDKCGAPPACAACGAGFLGKRCKDKAQGHPPKLQEVVGPRRGPSLERSTGVGVQGTAWAHHTAARPGEKASLLFFNQVAWAPRRNVNNEGEYERVRVTGERVDAVVNEDVALLKMDVEGFEPTAFQSAKGVLDTFKCAPLPGRRPLFKKRRQCRT